MIRRATTCGLLGLFVVIATLTPSVSIGQEAPPATGNVRSESQDEQAGEANAKQVRVQEEDVRPNEAEAIKQSDETAALKRRVDQLEQRVATLERLLLSRIIDASPDDREQLQSELQLARERYDHTKRLFDKGYVSKLELSSAQYGVERAELRLELAATATDHAEYSASMQLFEAQANLDLALQRLETSSHLAARGFITQTQLRSDQLDAERARQTVDAMRERLRADAKSEGSDKEAEPKKSDD